MILDLSKLNSCGIYCLVIRDDLQSIKEMGVDYAILQLTERDLNRVIDTAKQVSKSAK
jgi:hypothetical protein